MTLWTNLAVGSQALLSFQRGINTVSKNMTNVSTDGYKREVPVFKDDVIGATFDTAKRVYSQSLQSRYIATNQQNEYYGELYNSLSQIENVFNDIEGSGFSEALDNFFLSMNDVITSPDNLAARDGFLSQTQTLVGRIRGSYDELTNIKNANSNKLKDSITFLNDKLNAFAKINKELRYEQSALDNDRFNTLKNQQDALLQEISSYIDVKPRFNENGTVDIFTAKGHALVLEDRAFNLTFRTQNKEITITDTENNTSYTYNEPTPHILVDGVDLTADFQNGKIGAALKTDEAASETIKRLNTFTYKFANEINNQHKQGYDLNSNIGGDLFISDNAQTAVDASNITLAITDPTLVAAAANPDAVEADNQNFKELLNLKDAKFETLDNQSFNEYYNSSIVAYLGAQTAHIKNLADEKQALLDGIVQKIDEYSGVNLDEELINLQQLQRSYEASARIITVTDEMLQTVMGLIK